MLERGRFLNNSQRFYEETAMKRRDFGKLGLAVSALALGGSVMAAQTQTVSSEKNTALDQILARLTERDIPQHVGYDKRMIALITTATLTALGAETLLADQIRQALAAGIKPLQLREAMYQGFAYVGIARVSEAEKVLPAQMKAAGLGDQIEDATVVNDRDRFDKGLAIQKGIFGEAIDQIHKSARPDERYLNVDLLTGFCFGDTYTRTGLTLKERELLTFVFIAAMGGCEPQVKAHAGGNISVGNTRKMLIDALVVMLPYIGFPKTLNALAMVNEAAPAK